MSKITSIGYVNSENNKSEILKSFEYYDEKENFIFIYSLANITMIDKYNKEDIEYFIFITRVGVDNDVKYKLLSNKNKNLKDLENEFNEYLEEFEEKEDFFIYDINKINQFFDREKMKTINSIYLEYTLFN